MFKVTPSALESFRNYRLGTYDQTLESLIMDLTGMRVPTPEMIFGRRVHEFIETGKGEFDPVEARQLEEIRKDLTFGFNEIPLIVPFNTGTQEVYIRFRVDGLTGQVVHEIKTTANFKGVDYYEASYQWRVYLVATGAKMVFYHVIKYGTSVPRYFHRESFNFFTYPEMEKDVGLLIDDFIRFCLEHNLESVLTVDIEKCKSELY